MFSCASWVKSDPKSYLKTANPLLPLLFLFSLQDQNSFLTCVKLQNWEFFLSHLSHLFSLYSVRLLLGCIFPSTKFWVDCLFLFMEGWTALPPIRAESLLMALTKGWPGSAELGWSVEKNTEEKKKIRNGVQNSKGKRSTVKDTEKKDCWTKLGGGEHITISWDPESKLRTLCVSCVKVILSPCTNLL